MSSIPEDRASDRRETLKYSTKHNQSHRRPTTASLVSTLPDVPASPDVVGAHGVPVPPWIAALPCCLRVPIVALFIDMLYPEDEFLTILRKLVITFAAGMFYCPGLIAVYNNLTIDTWSTPAAIVARIIPFLLVPTWIGLYILLRLNAIGSAVAANAWIFTTFGIGVTVTISSPDLPTSEIFMFISVLSLLFRTSMLPVQVALCVLASVVANVNSTAYSRGPPEVELWALPGVIMRGFPTRVMLAISATSTAPFVWSALHFQLGEADRQALAARSSAELAQQVAELLGSYDTVKARILINTATEKGEVSRELLRSLDVLIVNLDKYRPHLPNWVLPHSNNDDDEGEISVSERKTADRVSSSGRSGAAVSVVDGAWLVPCEARASNVTMAMIDFTTGSSDDLNDWVLWMHEAASLTSGAVHSFVGDVAVVTWNAASRAIQSEAKAARFLARVKEYGEQNNADVRGAAITSSAVVQLAGNHQIQALTVHMDGMVIMNTLRRLARQLGGVLVDLRTQANSDFAVRYRPAAAQVVGDGVRMAGFEIIAEHNDAQEGEWMYVMEEQCHNGDGSAVSVSNLTKGLTAWARGDDAAARDALPVTAIVDTGASICEVLHQLCSGSRQRIAEGFSASALRE